MLGRELNGSVRLNSEIRTNWAIGNSGGIRTQPNPGSMIGIVEGTFSLMPIKIAKARCFDKLSMT
jgi:hypothetical protein|tara:strand:+ start:42 stop:236 length:195 start_codon:yes stop_codon:yes gene_type:complete